MPVIVGQQPDSGLLGQALASMAQKQTALGTARIQAQTERERLTAQERIAAGQEATARRGQDVAVATQGAFQERRAANEALTQMQQSHELGVEQLRAGSQERIQGVAERRQAFQSREAAKDRALQLSIEDVRGKIQRDIQEDQQRHELTRFGSMRERIDEEKTQQDRTNAYNMKLMGINLLDGRLKTLTMVRLAQSNQEAQVKIGTAGRTAKAMQEARQAADHQLRTDIGARVKNAIGSSNTQGSPDSPPDLTLGVMGLLRELTTKGGPLGKPDPDAPLPEIRKRMVLLRAVADESQKNFGLAKPGPVQDTVNVIRQTAESELQELQAMLNRKGLPANLTEMDERYVREMVDPVLEALSDRSGNMLRDLEKQMVGATLNDFQVLGINLGTEETIRKMFGQ